MNSDNAPLVSVVIPVYNGAKTLRELVDRLSATLTAYGSSFEIILVNDGSQDQSWPTIVALAENLCTVRGINLMKNFGQHNSLLAGILNARGDIIVTMDDDLQHPPEDLPSLLNKLSEGYDIVYGKPTTRQHSFWRNLSSLVLKSALKLVLGAEIGQHSSAFRAFRGTLRSGFSGFRDSSLSIDVLLSWSAANVTSVPVSHNPRLHGTSGYSLRKLFALALSMITGYSTLPLRLASFLGFATSLFGLSLFVYVVVRRFLQESYVPGFAFMAAEIALFSGLQLFAIGVIGEYLARVHFRTMGKPPFVIREIVANSPAPKSTFEDTSSSALKRGIPN